MDIGIGHTIGDAYIVIALTAAFVVWLYFRHVERQRRLEIIHQERLAAMEKGIPLPELPLDPPSGRTPPDPRAPLVHGLVWAALGFGAMVALLLIGQMPDVPMASPLPLPWRMAWPLPLPILFLGLGLMLYYVLVSKRAR